MARDPRLLRLVPLVLLAGCMGWCDLDPFGVTERRVAGGYRLKAVETGSYYLLTPADTFATFSGAPVQRLGWDRAHVIVLQAGDGAVPAGWAVIDVEAGRVRYGLTGAELAADPVARRLPTFSPDSAWARLASRAPGA